MSSLGKVGVPAGAADDGAFVWAVLYVTLRFAHRWRGSRVPVCFFIATQGASPLPTLCRPSGTLEFAGRMRPVCM